MYYIYSTYIYFCTPSLQTPKFSPECTVFIINVSQNIFFEKVSINMTYWGNCKSNFQLQSIISKQTTNYHSFLIL